MLTVPQNSASDSTTVADLQLVPVRIAQTLSRIAAAARQAGRDPSSVCLLAVGKQHPPTAIRAAAEAGLIHFGESYLQEALPKMDALSELPLVWHYIGHIQSNKTRPIAERFAWVHTVDRIKVAERLSQQRPPDVAPLNVCLQVKLENEPGKAGVQPDELEPLAHAVAQLPQIKLRGLMCIPPPRDDYDAQLALFRRCAQLRNDLIAQGLTLDTLSMGMSGDLEAAVAAGSTVVRIGTALFGERNAARRT